MIPMSAGRAITQVMERCETAKESKFLDLGGCGLMYVADAIYLLLKEYEIHKCSLAHNGMKKFPSKMITKFADLKHFSMEGNKLTELPEAIAEWKHLKSLNLGGNNFEFFPEIICEIKGLNWLDISCNQIKELDIEKLFNSLPDLKLVNISGNPFPEGHLDHLLEFGRKNARLKVQYAAAAVDDKPGT